MTIDVIPHDPYTLQKKKEEKQKSEPWNLIPQLLNKLKNKCMKSIPSSQVEYELKKNRTTNDLTSH